MPDSYYRNGIPTRTGFEGNGFGIDPDGCGCTDCILRHAFHPSDTYALREALRQGRPLHNRTGYEVILPNGFRLDDGKTWPWQPPRTESDDIACDWSDYLKNYSVNEHCIPQAHKAFKAGWEAARGKSHESGPLR